MLSRTEPVAPTSTVGAAGALDLDGRLALVDVEMTPP